MKTLLVLAVLVAVTSAAVYKWEAKNAGSLRAKLLAQGEDVYHNYLAQVNKARISNLNVGSQTLIDYYDDFYLVNITVGTPAQTFTVVPDTGSSNLWIIDSLCTSDYCIGKGGYTKKRFDSSKSSTYQTENTTFSIQYGAGACSGHLAKDTLSFAGLTIPVQEFGLSESLDSTFEYQPVDGIMGMGWPSLAVDQVVPPLQNLLPQLDAPIFTFWMDRLKMSEGGNGGMITYGGFDKDHCASEINYVPLTDLSYWQFSQDSFSIGTYTYNQVDDVISDTGTSWLGVPEAVLNNILKQVGASYDFMDQIYTVQCSATSKLPDIILTIGGIKYNIPAVEYVLDLGLTRGRCALTFFSMGSSFGGPAWILGDTFIRSYCQVYDIGNQRIGFALAKHSFTQ